MSRITTWRHARVLACGLGLAVWLPGHAPAAQPDAGQTARGLYLLRISGCNDCHTPGYAENGGKTPTAAWLTGSPVGFNGPWGTTYPGNLRLYFQRMSEAQWLQRARLPMRPPMPWFALRDMSESDLRAVYQAVRSLGAAGAEAPEFVPPDREPAGLFISFVPRRAAVAAAPAH